MTSSQDDLCALPVHALAPLIRDRQVSPRELVAACLARVERVDAALHAFVDVWADDALAAAAAAEQDIAQGQYRGPLHGIPVSLKDLVEVAGHRTTVGSAFFKDRVSTHTATLATRLVDAGAILLGKVHMVEFAFGGWGTNPRMGAPRNPWDPVQHRSPGGSSSGSGVSVASGMVPVSIGSDTGGSIRLPASMNGVVGLKPTAAAVSNHGVFPLSQTLDSMGPLTRSVEDAAHVFAAIRGADPFDAATALAPPDASVETLRQSIRGLRIGRVRASQLPDVDDQCLSSAAEASQVLQSLGAEIVDIELPRQPVDYCTGASHIIRTEGYANLANIIETPGADFGPAVRARVLAGKGGLAVDFARTLIERRADTAAMQRAMAQIDALLLPTTPMPSPPLSSVKEEHMPLSDLTRFVNYLGLCALALPCGVSRDGMPLSLQLVGGAFQESTVLRIGWAFEQATAWHRRRPDLSAYGATAT
ncbi:MAG: amidase [Gammaproteobacteria bacterium]|nr:amidase [Gammaproteobacteria bacterium]